MTLAFELNRPWGRDKHGFSPTWISIWHVDPCKDGSDDSCGWFIRPRHCDQKKLATIEKRFEEDFDRVWQSDSGTVYHCGLFLPVPSGLPNMSVHGIALNLFLIACNVHFSVDGTTNWKKSRKWMQEHLFDILHFAESPHDSLHDGFIRKFEIGCNEEYTERKRKERIRSLAGCIYSYILREDRPWYRHPRWHLRHWKIQIHPLQKYWRWLTKPCCVCGKRIRTNETPMTNWDGNRFWHQSCDGLNKV